MARPPKKGLSYFPKDVDYYQDTKIVRLAIKYGPLGLVTYDVLLTLIYREGYFAKMSVSDAALNVVRTVGDRWYTKNGMSAIDLAAQIILYCAEIGLLDEPLVRQGVMTSVGIQRRYAAVTVRNKVKFTEYRLLDDNGNSIVEENVSEPEISITETPVIGAETPVSVTIMPQNKEKENKINKSKYVSRKQELTCDCIGQDDEIGKVISEFKRLLPRLNAEITDRLVKLIHNAGRPIDYYTLVFSQAAKSSFLSSPRPGWSCSLEWLCDPENAEKVLSGRYEDFSPVKPVQADTTRHKPEIINGVENGFDTESMFEAALRRGMRGCRYK